MKNKMIIHPCNRLEGRISLQGAKNSALPIMAAAVAGEGVTVIENCPAIEDVYNMMGLLEECGCTVKMKGRALYIDSQKCENGILASEGSRRMRASILLMGACLGRFGEFRMNYPGGCAIGKRPIDFHVTALQKMGADTVLEKDYFGAKAEYLHGASIELPFPSVGATQNIIIAAMRAEGVTEIYNASKEPEIWDLCNYLKLMGIEVYGEKTGHIIICNRNADYKRNITIILPADRIVAGTIMTAVACTTGNVYIDNVEPERLECISKILGAKRDNSGRGVILNIDKRPVIEEVITTGPFPMFPTDMQSQFMTLMSVSKRLGIIEENVFDTRYAVAEELKKLGANIIIKDRWAYIQGVNCLRGGNVDATDLRGGAALVLAGLVASEPVTVNKCYHIHRGHENLAGDLNKLGAQIYEEDI